MLKKKGILILIFVVVLIFVGCTSQGKDEDLQENNKPNGVETKDKTQDNEDNLEGNNSENKANENTSNSMVNYEDIKISPIEAFDIYMEKYPDTKVKKVQLDKEKDTYTYEVEGFDQEKEYKLKIDPMDGKVLKEKEERDREEHHEISKESLKEVDNLVKKALEDAGDGATLDGWEVDYEDGKSILEVEINISGREDIEYKYDLETGELIQKD